MNKKSSSDEQRLAELHEKIEKVKLAGKKNRCVAIYFQKRGTSKDRTYIAISGYNFRKYDWKKRYEFLRIDTDKIEVESGFIFGNEDLKKVKEIVKNIYKNNVVNLKWRSLHQETPTIFLDCEYIGNIVYGKYKLVDEIQFRDYFNNFNINKNGLLGFNCFNYIVKRLFSCAERKLDRLLCENNDYRIKKLIISKEMCDLCIPFKSKWENHKVKIIV